MYMIYDNVLGLLTMDTLIILNGVFVKFRLKSDQFLFISALPTNTCDYYRGVSVLFPESFTEKTIHTPLKPPNKNSIYSMWKIYSYYS